MSPTPDNGRRRHRPGSGRRPYVRQRATPPWGQAAADNGRHGHHPVAARNTPPANAATKLHRVNGSAPATQQHQHQPNPTTTIAQTGNTQVDCRFTRAFMYTALVGNKRAPWGNHLPEAARMGAHHPKGAPYAPNSHDCGLAARALVQPSTRPRGRTHHRRPS